MKIMRKLLFILCLLGTQLAYAQQEITIDDIYKKAIKDKNDPQLIKTMLFKSKFAMVAATSFWPWYFNEVIKDLVTPENAAMVTILSKLVERACGCCSQMKSIFW